MIDYSFTDNTFSLSKFALISAFMVFATSSALGVTLEEGTYSPEPNMSQQISNQKISFGVLNLSADGNTDTFYVHFDHNLTDTISVNQASVQGASISSSAEFVGGRDGDEVTDTVRFAVSPDASGNVSVNVTVDFSVTYPNRSAVYPVEATVEDSKYGVESEEVVEIEVGESEDNENSSDQESGSQDSDTSGSDEDETESTETGETSESNDEEEPSEQTSDENTESSGADDTNDSSSQENQDSSDQTEEQENSSASDSEGFENVIRPEEANESGSSPEEPVDQRGTGSASENSGPLFQIMNLLERLF